MKTRRNAAAAVLMIGFAGGVAGADSAERAAGLHPIAAQVAARLEDPDQPFILIVELQVKPGREAEFTAAANEPLAETVKEAGNLAYALSRRVSSDGGDSEDGGVSGFYLYEHWKSVAALDAHLKQPYLVAFLGKLDGLLAEAPGLNVCLPVPPPGD